MSLRRNQTILVGPPGAGKTTIGRMVAEALGQTFLDTDEEIERITNGTVGKLIREQGEEAFRAIETDTLKSLPRDEAVISLGGGTLTIEDNLREARRRGAILGLTADAKTLRERLGKDSTDRPLLEEGALEALLTKREETYRRVDITIPCEDSTQHVGASVEAISRQTTVIEAQVGESTSRVIVGRSLTRAIGTAVGALRPRRPVVVCTDGGVPETRRREVLSGLANQDVVHLELEGGEPCKSWDRLGAMLEMALARGAGRGSVVVGVGGGAVCDVVALFASLLGRGCPVVLVPTTLLSMVDASVGGKCAVNLEAGRNLAGAFHAATDVVVDLDYLESLPREELISGLAEALKMGVIGDAGLFHRLVEGAGEVAPKDVARCIELKAEIVARDPFERGERKKLNLGHTLGHALEAASEYTLKHGEAVAIGTAAIVRYGRARGTTDKETARHILSGLQRVGLPILANPGLAKRSEPYIIRDKKADTKNVDIVLVRKLGEVVVERLELEKVGPELVRNGVDS